MISSLYKIKKNGIVGLDSGIVEIGENGQHYRGLFLDKTTLYSKNNLSVHLQYVNTNNIQKVDMFSKKKS